jgi:hypothetical protein
MSPVPVARLDVNAGAAFCVLEPQVVDSVTFWYGPDTIDPPLDVNVADAPPPLKTQFGALLPIGVGVGVAVEVAADVGLAVGVAAGEDDGVAVSVAVTTGMGAFEEDDPVQAASSAPRPSPAAVKRKNDPERACTSASLTTSEFR